MPVGPVVVEAAESHPVEQADGVDRRETRGQQADQGGAREGGPAALEHQQLGREPCQTGNASGGHQGQQQHAGGEGEAAQGVEQTGELGNRRGAGLALDQSLAGEHQGHDQPVGQDLGHSALEAHRGGGGDGEHQQPHVAQGAVGHQQADVGLGDGIEGTVNHTHGSGGGDPR